MAQPQQHSRHVPSAASFVWQPSQPADTQSLQRHLLPRRTSSVMGRNRADAKCADWLAQLACSAMPQPLHSDIASGLPVGPSVTLPLHSSQNGALVFGCAEKRREKTVVGYYWWFNGNDNISGSLAIHAHSQLIGESFTRQWGQKNFPFTHAIIEFDWHIDTLKMHPRQHTIITSKCISHPSNNSERPTYKRNAQSTHTYTFKSTHKSTRTDPPRWHLNLPGAALFRVRNNAAVPSCGAVWCGEVRLVLAQSQSLNYNLLRKR